MKRLMRISIAAMMIALSSVVVSTCISTPEDASLRAGDRETERQHVRDVLVVCIDEDQRTSTHDRFPRVRAGASSCGARQTR